MLKKWKPLIKNWADVEAYQQATARKSDFERGELNKDKTGIRLEGIEVINPATGKVVPMFVSDYVLMGYGTGIVMGVPGHDQRDWDFATKFGLPIVEVVKGGDITKEAFTLKDDTGIMVNSGFLNGMTVKEAIPAMKKYAGEQGWGPRKGQLQAPRLGLLPPALLGRADPDDLLPEVRLGARARGSAAAGSAAGREL